MLDLAGPLYEECDDGNRINGDGCNSDCKKEYLPRTHVYTDPSWALVQELGVWNNGTLNHSDCKSPYLPTQNADVFNPAPTPIVCYTGRYCYECKGPRFPGYPLLKSRFLSDTPYGFIPTIHRGRLRAITYMDEVAASFVINSRTIIRNNGTDLVINHDGIGATRLSLGRYYFQSKGNNVVQVYTLSDSIALACRMQLAHESTKIVPPQQGNDFYMWWPGPNLLMSRQYNGRNIEFYALHNKTLDSFTNPSAYSEDLLFNEVIVPPLEIVGDILMDPVVRAGKLYVPLYIEDILASSTKVYQVNVYQSDLPWYISKFTTVTVTKALTSIASFVEGVVVSINHTTPFYSIDGNVACSLKYTGVNPTCDTSKSPIEWNFIQSRPDPDNAIESPQAYAYCSKYTLYKAYYFSANATVVLDTQSPIALPDDQPESRNIKGRYNLYYPYDINGKFLVNFAIHPCDHYVLYRWDEWNHASISMYNLEEKTTRCYNITLTEPTFD